MKVLEKYLDMSLADQQIHVMANKFPRHQFGSMGERLITEMLVYLNSEVEKTADEDFKELHLYLDEGYWPFCRYQSVDMYINVLKTMTEFEVKPNSCILNIDETYIKAVFAAADKKRKELEWI